MRPVSERPSALQIWNAASIRGGLPLLSEAMAKPPASPDQRPIVTLAPPEELVVPLLGYRWQTVESLVSAGDRVMAGDRLAEGVVAPANGIIKAIESRPVAHPGGLVANSVVIATLEISETQNNASDTQALSTQGMSTDSHVLTLEHLRAAGIRGLGGAGFSTVDKFIGKVHTLVINAVECEPYISCDNALLISEPENCLTGSMDLMSLSGASRCIIAIEDDMPDALQSLQMASKQSAESGFEFSCIEIAVVPSIYPAGAERPLLQSLLRLEFNATERPIDHGIALVNIATAYAAGRARRGIPLVERVVSIAGPAATRPGNYRLRFGTPIRDALQASGNLTEDIDVRMGGPLNGFSVINHDAPVTVACNALILTPAKTTLAHPPSERPCIRCGACSNHCPVALYPQEMLRFAEASDWQRSADSGLDICIECGVCDLVCPSQIRLTEHFRHAKGALRQERERNQAAQTAEHRMHARERRLAEREAQRANSSKSTDQSAGISPAANPGSRRQRRRKPNPRQQSKP